MTRLLAILCAALLLPMTGCDNDIKYDAFDAETEGIVDVVTETCVLSGVGALEQERTERYYYTVATGQRVQLTEPFEPESTEVLDGQGNSMPSNEIIEKILVQLQSQQKSFFCVKIFEVDGEYFPYVELNVNLWDPCRLYYYDQARDALVELNTWDAEEVIGLRLRSLDNIGN